MPITHIHKITQTLSRGIAYGSADKVEQGINKDDIADAIKYGSSDKEGEVIFYTLNSWQNCPSMGSDVSGDFRELLEKFPRKRSVREGEEPALAFHLVQGFDGYIPPQLANQIGREFAREFLPDYAVQISTHTNTENIHNHIIFCAVNRKGERYNDCDSTYAEMRRVSDKICAKYGLELLEGTREYKPIHWTDENGVKHAYEPTKRKQDIARARAEGKASPDDVSSYRNSQAYQEWTIGKLTEKETVKRDIDAMLPLALSYEHLLTLLRENMGYTIHDKKVNGDWLAHTSFTPPNFEKGVRDYKISEDGYYTRENLEKVIEELRKHPFENEQKQEDNSSHGESDTRANEASESDIPIYDTYDYSRVDLSRLSEDKRAWKRNDNTVEYIDRGIPEKVVIRSAKQTEKELHKKLSDDGFQAGAVDYISRHAFDDATIARYRLSKAQSDYAQARAKEIQDRLNALHFLEENNLLSFARINAMVQNLWSQYNSSFDTLNDIGKKLNNARFIADIPDNLEKLQKRIASHKGDADYMESEYSHDRATEQKLLSLMQKYNLNSPEDVEQLKANISRWENQYQGLTNRLADMKKRLNDYEGYVGIIRTSTRGSREEFDLTWDEFERIQKQGKEEEKDKEGVRNQQTKARKGRDRI